MESENDEFLTDFFPSDPFCFSGSMLVFGCVRWEAAVAWVEKESWNYSGFIHRCRRFLLVYKRSTHATKTKNMSLSSQTHSIDVLHKQGRFVQNRISAIWHARAKGCAWGNRWALWPSKLEHWHRRSRSGQRNPHVQKINRIAVERCKRWQRWKALKTHGHFVSHGHSIHATLVLCVASCFCAESWNPSVQIWLILPSN